MRVPAPPGAVLWEKFAGEFAIPYAAHDLCNQREKLRVARRHVLRVVRAYNGILDALAPDERRLFADHLRRLDKRVNQVRSGRVRDGPEPSGILSPILPRGVPPCLLIPYILLTGDGGDGPGSLCNACWLVGRVHHFLIC